MTEQWDIETIKNKNYNEILKIVGSNITLCRGSTSKSFTTSNFFIKCILRYNNFDIYEREKHMANILKDFKWYPKLLYSDDINKILIFKNVGVPVTAQNNPEDLKIQFNKILQDMKSINVQHNDIKLGEILIDNNNKIYLCDFGWASINNNMNCGIGLWECNNKRKPGGWFNDDNVLTRLGLF